MEQLLGAFEGCDSGGAKKEVWWTMPMVIGVNRKTLDIMGSLDPRTVSLDRVGEMTLAFRACTNKLYDLLVYEWYVTLLYWITNINCGQQ